MLTMFETEDEDYDRPVEMGGRCDREDERDNTASAVLI